MSKPLILCIIPKVIALLGGEHRIEGSLFVQYEEDENLSINWIDIVDTETLEKISSGEKQVRTEFISVRCEELEHLKVEIVESILNKTSIRLEFRNPLPSVLFEFPAGGTENLIKSLTRSKVLWKTTSQYVYAFRTRSDVMRTLYDLSNHPIPVATSQIFLVPAERLTVTEWNITKGFRGSITEEGWQSLIPKIYSHGMDAELRKEVWLYLTGVYVAGQNAEERRTIENVWREKFNSHLMFYNSITQQQLYRFSSFRDTVIQIRKDCHRTDSTLPFYQNDERNVEKMERILLVHAVMDFDFGYIQGMSDFASTFLCVQEGDEVLAFACFCKTMERLKPSFCSDHSIDVQLRKVKAILRFCAPSYHTFLKKYGLIVYSTIFRWIAVWFKREFTNANLLHIWESIFTNLCGEDTHTFIAASLLFSCRKEIVKRESMEFGDLTTLIFSIGLEVEIQQVLVKAFKFYTQYSKRRQRKIAQ